MLGAIQVLHVDDDPAFADLTATYLEREDDRITVETATSGAEGLDQLSDQIDCVVSDYDMPGMNGLEFLETVREEYPDLPFILHTGKGGEEVASEAISAGVTDYLQKGHGSEQYELLVNRLTNTVEQARARRQADKHHRVSTVVRDINRALVEATSQEEISHRVCQIITGADPYVFAWIGTVDSASDRIEPTAAAGIHDGYLEDITVTADESPTGRGPGGRAVREDRVVVSQNIQDDEAFTPWRDEALERGYRAVAGIPLSHDDTRYGLLGLYADRPAAFDEAERELLAELGDTIAHAYHRVEIQTQYEDQYRELFEEAPVMFAFTREVDGEPVIEDCNQLFVETLGYTREELCGTRLAEVYTDESARTLLGGGGYDRALTGEFAREQRDFVTSDGDVVETLLRATPRRSTEGEVVGTHALFVDVTDQTRLQTLESLRERMEFALDATDSVLFEMDLDSGQETRNGPFERLYGISTERVEANSRFYEKCVHPADRDTLRDLQARESVAETDGTIACDFRTNPDRGEDRWIYSEAYVSTGPDGTPQRLIGLDTDITDRKERERKLTELNRATQSLLTAETPQEVAETGVTAAKDILGLEASGIHFARADDAQLVAAARTEEANALTSETLSLPVSGSIAGRVYRDGEPTVIEDVQEDPDVYDPETDLRAHAYLPLAGHGILIAGSESRAAFDNQELTFGELLAGNLVAALDRVEREAQLDRERERYATFFEVLPNPVLHVRVEDSEPVVQTVNPAFVDTFGYDAGTIQDEPLHEYILPDDRADAARRLTERILEEGEVRTEVRRETTEGVRTFRLDARAHNTGSRNPEGYSVYTDITERKEYERELEAQTERLDEFASIVSHDLRSPLTVAEGHLELGQETCESEHLARAADAIDRCQALIDDLLTLARDGQEGVEHEPVGLADVAERSWQTVDTQRATLETDAARVIRADRSRLQQLFENLYRNAVEHGGDGVTVHVGELDRGFYVADTGPGIPEGDRDEIFDAGYSTAESGTGFGLRIVEQIAESHGWEVCVTEGDRGGARFEITGLESVDR